MKQIDNSDWKFVYVYGLQFSSDKCHFLSSATPYFLLRITSLRGRIYHFQYHHAATRI